MGRIWSCDCVDVDEYIQYDYFYEVFGGEDVYVGRGRRRGYGLGWGQ